jgi:hypothetical protein
VARGALKVVVVDGSGSCSFLDRLQAKHGTFGGVLPRGPDHSFYTGFIVGLSSQKKERKGKERLGKIDESPSPHIPVSLARRCRHSCLSDEMVVMRWWNVVNLCF